MDAAERHGGPAPDFLEFRRNQLELLLALADVRVSGTVLEIGGGLSGQAMLLSDLADTVVCTELPIIEGSHTGDIRKAAALARSMPAVKFVAARAEALPFASSSVDVVLSSYVFEHVSDRAAAAREIGRVLRPGGHLIAAVPNRMEPVHRALQFYLVDLPKQLVKIAMVWSGFAGRLRVRVRTQPQPRPDGIGNALAVLAAEFSYRPHGTYFDRVAEIRLSDPRVWDSIFESAGLRITRRFTISLEQYLAFFNPTIALWWQRRLMGLLRRFGDARLVVMLGHAYCFAAQRPADQRGTCART